MASVALVGLPVDMAAQAGAAMSGASATVSGIVFDSVSTRRMAGATVQLVNTAPPNPARSTTSDSTGRFRFADVPVGVYVAGFYHPTTDSLGLQPREVRVDVRDGQPVEVVLGVPSPLTIVRGVCGDRADKDTTGLFLGVVRNATDDTPVGGATVVAEWSQVTLRRGGTRREIVSSTATTTESGWFALCNLPVGFGLEARATSERDSSGYLQIDVGDRRLLHRDVYVGRAELAPHDVRPAGSVVDSLDEDTLPRYQGRARLHGRVQGTNGSALPSAQVSVRGSAAVGVSDAQGNFALSSLPEGTYELSVRAIGFVPESRMVDLRASRDAEVAVGLTPIGVYLDTVRVKATRTYASRNLQEFERRKRRGFGRFIEGEEIAKRHALTVASLIRDTPGLEVRYSPNAHQEVVYARSGAHPCVPDLFVDGMRIPTGAMDIDTFLRPDDLRAIEVYANWMDVPFEFMGSRAGQKACGAIALWRGAQPKAAPDPPKKKKPDTR